MDIQKDLLQTEVGQGSLNTKFNWPWPKKNKTKGSFNVNKKNKDKQQKTKTNRSIWKSFKKCSGLLAEDGTCTKPESTTT
jgi:hypothetical protein